MQNQSNSTSSSVNDRPLISRVNGAWHFRASACGTCLRALTAARLGYQETPVPAWLLDAAQRGHECEQQYKKFRRGSGIRIVAEQVEVRVPVPGTNALITGHVDGVEIDKRPYLLEVKSMSERQFAKWVTCKFQEFVPYLAQISVYAWAINLPVKYVVIPRHLGIDHADITYLTRSDIIRYGGGLDMVVRKIQEVEKWARKRELPECDTDSLYCRFDYLCTKANRRR